MTPDEIKTATVLQLTKSVADFGLVLFEIAQTQSELVSLVKKKLPELSEADQRELTARTATSSIQIAAAQEKLELIKAMIR